MDERRAVSPEIASMASADAAKKQTVTTAQQIANLNTLVQKAFDENKWQELAKLSNQMVALQASQKREVAAKLEAKLVTEFAEVLDAYEVELEGYTEARIYILHKAEGGMEYKLTLMDTVAPVRKAAAKSTSAERVVDKNGFETDSHGLPTTESLLGKYGDTVQDEKAGTTWKAAIESAKGQKNKLYQLRVKLLKLAGY